MESRAVFLGIVVFVMVSACEAPRAAPPAVPATPAASPSAAPYVPQDVPEDHPPPPPAGGPTAADPDIARIDRSLGVVRGLLDALPKTDAGVPLSSSAAVCLQDLRAQIDTARRSAEDRRDSIRGASKRGDDEVVKHDLAIVRVLADRAEQLAAEAKNCH